MADRKNGNRRKRDEPQDHGCELDRGMPMSVEAEKAILGAILLDNFAYTESADMLTVDDFSIESHRNIYRTMRFLGEQGVPIDLITLSETIASKGSIERVGGFSYLASLTEGLPHRPSVDSYVRIVKDKALLRSLIHSSNLAIARAMEGSDDVSWIISELAEQVMDLRAGRVKKPARHVAEVAAQALVEMRQQMVAKRELLGLSFGITELDLMTTGMRKGEVTILGGYPGSGKTAFASNIALINARGETTGMRVPTVIFSKEMKDVAVTKRILSQYTEVSASKMRNPRHLMRSELELLDRAIPLLSDIPIWIDEDCGRDISELDARARYYIHKYRSNETDEFLIIVDYLQMLAVGDDKRRDEVGYISSRLAKLAKETGAHVLSLSQLSRPDGKDPNTVPKIFMLRDSGKIEQDAHLVLFTYRPVDEKMRPTGVDEAIIVGKQREGEQGPVPAKYNTRTLRWENPSHEVEVDPQQSLSLGQEDKKSKSRKGKS